MRRRKPANNNLNICLVSEDPARALSLGSGLAQAGLHVGLVCSHRALAPGHQSMGSIEIMNLEAPLITSHSLSDALCDQVVEWHRTQHFDLIHTFDEKCLMLSPLKKHLGVALACSLNSTRLAAFFDLLGSGEPTVVGALRLGFRVAQAWWHSYWSADRRWMARSDLVFVTSHRQSEYLEMFFSIARAKIKAIPVGALSVAAEKAAPDRQIFGKYKVAATHKTVLICHSLQQIQELKNLCSAFEKLAIKKPDVSMVIVGKGPRQFELESHILSLALTSRIHIIPSLPEPELATMIASCDLFVDLAYQFTGYATETLQALMQERPVVASEVGIMPDLIKNGVNGFLVNPSAPSSIAEMLLDYFSQPVGIKEIGRRGRETVLKTFDPSPLVEETIEAYRMALGRAALK